MCAGMSVSFCKHLSCYVRVCRVRLDGRYVGVFVCGSVRICIRASFSSYTHIHTHMPFWHMYETCMIGVLCLSPGDSLLVSTAGIGFLIAYALDFAGVKSWLLSFPP